MKNLTVASKALLGKLQQEATDFDGNETLLCASELTKSEAGSLTDLKKKGLVSTCPTGEKGKFWVILTDAALMIDCTVVRTEAANDALAQIRELPFITTEAAALDMLAVWEAGQ
tara:strand:- start:8457 stop:8798 length:342 start_codon:yes stop_codon:yes gene_type:complete